MEKKSKLSILTNGIIRENPTLVLLLGTCPFLATSSSLINALGMGLSATAVLICSNIVISMLRKVIPDKVRSRTDLFQHRNIDAAQGHP